MSRNARGFFIWTLIICSGGGALSGCGGRSAEGPELPPASVGLDDAAREPRSGSESVSPGQPGEHTPESIARQFERDMQEFRAMKSPSEGAAENASEPLGRREDAVPRVVQFNDRGSTDRSRGSIGGSADETHTRTDWNPDDPWNRGSAVRRPIEENERVVEAADQPIDRPPAERLREAMVDLRRELYQTASYADSPLREYMAMAALAMIDPDRALDPDALHDLNAREREMLRAYQQFFLDIGQELSDPGDEGVLIELIDELRQNVTNTGPMQIVRAELCTRVDGFGKITTFDKYAFLAGTGQDVVIYSEIEGFTSTQNGQGMWVTDLWQELVIYNSADRVPVWRDDWRAVPDVASRKRTDFFITHITTIPERLSPGQYSLKIRVRDQKTGSVAETGVDFQIVADESLAARVPD